MLQPNVAREYNNKFNSAIANSTSSGELKIFNMPNRAKLKMGYFSDYIFGGNDPETGARETFDKPDIKILLKLPENVKKQNEK